MSYGGPPPEGSLFYHLANWIFSAKSSKSSSYNSTPPPPPTANQKLSEFLLSQGRILGSALEDLKVSADTKGAVSENLTRLYKESVNSSIKKKYVRMLLLELKEILKSESSIPGVSHFTMQVEAMLTYPGLEEAS